MLVPQQVQDDVADATEDEDAANEISVKPTPHLPTPATTPPPQQELIPSPLQVESTPPPSPHQSPIAQPSSPPPQQPPSRDAKISMTLLNTLLETCATLTKQVANLKQDKIAQAIEITKLKQRVGRLEKNRKLKASGFKRLRNVGTAQIVESSTDTAVDDQDDASKQGEIAELDADEDVTLEEIDVEKDAEVEGRFPESQAQVYYLDLEHAQKVLSMQETDEAEPVEVEEVLEVVTAAKLMTEVVTTATTHITVAPVPKASAPRRKKVVIIQDPEEATTTSLKELKTHLQIVPNDEDDVYTKATPLALKVPIIDYQIHNEHNKPYYKIIRADSTHQLFLSFISLLRNFDREDLEMLWMIVQERFESLEPRNFSDEFLLNALKTMFEKPNVEDNIWINQRGMYGLAKVKSWKLLEFCGVHIITFTSTQMIMLVERRYPLTRFTLE
nr:hypothetical protein [Tanacetum cinerariifolium]